MHIPKFLRVGRSRSRNLSSVDSTDANRASRSPSPPAEHASSARPSSSLGTSLPGHPIAAPLIGRTLGDSASQLDHKSQPVSSLAMPQLPHLTATSSPGSSMTQSPAYSSLKTNAPSNLSVVPQPSQAPATAMEQRLLSPQLTYPATVYGVQNINDSRNISIDGNMNSVTYMNPVVGGPGSFMEKLLDKTIPGAAFDSSTRDPPPRCHPGTRLAILERCIYFILNCRDARKMRWVFGAAGVGKSAIMQSVAENPLSLATLRASIFFFVHGRSDGSKAIITLAYQLAAESEPYRLFIERELARDPSLLQKSMSVQFNKLIVEPFVYYPPLNSVGRVLIIIDGLDECDNRRTQEELLRLISSLCITYPSSPLVWIIASRPEPHITAFFAQNTVERAYEKEEILVDSDEAREDVERFLRSELSKVQIEFSLNPGVQWPSEQDFWKLAQASGGLFVYAYTVAKYIGDPDAGNPISQLDDVLKIIDAHPLPNMSKEEHPMAQLDALYARILSKVPVKANPNMRKLFLALAVDWETRFEPERKKFIVLCNWLGLTYHDAYAAIRHLFSVLKVPRRDEAHEEELGYFHKSFIDYICDFTRSGFSPDIKQESLQLKTQCAFRVLEQVPDIVDFGDGNYTINGSIPTGRLARGTGAGRNIALTWPVDDGMSWDNNKTRFCMYKLAIGTVVEGIRNRQQVFYNIFCIRLLATRFADFIYCGVENLHAIVFDKSHRHEFLEQGIVKQVPLKMLNFADIGWRTQLALNCPSTRSTDLPDLWNSSCKHERAGEWGEDSVQAWTTEFVAESRNKIFASGRCSFCCQRLKRQLESWQTRDPDHPVPVLFTSTGTCFVEFRFVDEEDGVSEWTYWLVHEFKEKKRKELGSTV